MGELHFNYVNARSAGYRANICKIGQNVYDPLQYWVKKNFTDIEITRPKAPSDLSKVHNKCLVTVNGYVYPTQYSDSRLYIPNATVAMLKSKANHLGILSFNLLQDNLTKYTIAPSNITPDGIYSLYDKCIITFDTPIRTPVLIIGGYMQLEEEGIFYRISDTSFALSLNRLSYIERLYETNRYRDIFKELDIPTSVNNISMVDGTTARSDAVILKYLTCFNSFLVDVPVSQLHVKKIYLNQANIPSAYTTDSVPRYPLVTGNGKFSEYSYSKGPQARYILTTLDAYYNNHLLSKLNKDQVKTYNDHRVVGTTYQLSNAYMLDMYANV